MLCAAHALEDLGEAKIVAVVHDSAAHAGVGAISVINDYYGRAHIPIGACARSALLHSFLYAHPLHFRTPLSSFYLLRSLSM